MHRRLTALLAVPLLALAACTAATASPPTPPQPPPAGATPSPAQSSWPGDQAVMDASVIVGDVAPQRWPDAYAGLAVDLPGRALIVHRVPTRGLDEAVRSLVPAVEVRFVDARYSARTLDAWVEQVNADFGYWQARGIPLYSVEAVPGEHVQVAIADPQRDAPAIRARYPRMPLRVVQGSPLEPALSAN